MQVHRLRLVNFRQHEETDLTFDLGLTGVMGPNGSGKTTLLEALAWAIYGTKAARGTVDSIRRRNAPARARVEVTAEFTLGAHRYQVTRTLHGAELLQDAEAAPIAITASAVTERLTRIIGMSREEFFNTYFTGQKELAIMGSMGATERQRFLSRVLGYERLGAVQKLLLTERTELKARLQTIEASLVSPADLAREEAAAAGQLEAAVTRAKQGERTLAEAIAALATERPAWERMERLQEQVRSLESDLRVAEQQVRDGRAAFDRLDRELAEALSARTRLQELEPQLVAWPELEAERTRLDGLAARLAQRREVMGQQKEVRERLTEVVDRLTALPAAKDAPAVRAEAEASQARLRAAEAVLQERHTEWVRDQQDASTKRKQLLDQYEDLRQQRDRLRDAGAEGVCPTCGRPLGAEFGDVVAQLGRQLEEITFNGNFYRQRIEQLKAEPKDVTGAREAVALQREEADRLTADVTRLTEVDRARRTLEADRVALAARLGELDERLAGTTEDYDEARHALVVETLTRLAPVREEATKLSVLAERAAALATQAAEIEAHVSEREERARALSRQLVESGWSAEAWAEARARYERVVQSRQEMELAQVRAASELTAARTAVAAVAARREERERRAAEARALGVHLMRNQELDRAMADLRAQLNETLRPDLSDLGSRFLRDLTMGRYTEFELDADYQPTIVEDGEPQTVLSGGEEDVVSLALRLAISQMIADRAGQPLSLLVLDEIFGSLDEERRGAVVDLLRRLADRFPQVILITHIDTVRDGFDRILRLTYDVERGVARVAEEPVPGHDAAA